jgi:hypothetical protein
VTGDELRDPIQSPLFDRSLSFIEYFWTPNEGHRFSPELTLRCRHDVASSVEWLPVVCGFPWPVAQFLFVNLVTKEVFGNNNLNANLTTFRNLVPHNYNANVVLG